MLRLGALDADLAAMLLRMARGVLQDTVLLLLSDHGTHGIWYTEYEIGATCAPLPFESDRLPSRRVALAASEGGPVQLGSIYAHGEVMPLQAISSDLEQSQISRATPSVSCTPTPPPPPSGSEHQLPFLYMVLPDWLLRARPAWHAALRVNQRRLVTAHELYRAMQQLAAWPESAPEPSRTARLSVFEELPETRSCQDAGIPEVYCACRRDA